MTAARPLALVTADAPRLPTHGEHALDHELPFPDEIPVVAPGLGIPEELVPWLVELAERRVARAAEERRAEQAGRKLAPRTYADPDAQTEAAFWAMYESKADFPRLPWGDADAICGPLVPGDLVMVGARTGGGKTTLLLNLLDAWVAAGRTIAYLGLEQKPKELRTKWAALRAGVPPEVPLAHDLDRWHRPLAEGLALVAREFAAIAAPEMKRRARILPVPYVDAETLEKCAAWCAREGYQVLVVDHIDRVDHGEGRNPFAEMSYTIRRAKELAVEHKLVMLLASQAKRVADKLERFMPMELADLRGGGTKEEESDIVLTAYRPLRPDVDPKELTAVRQGLASEESVIQPNVMGLKTLKSRRNGARTGRTCRLVVRHGRLEPLTIPAGPPPVRSALPDPR